MLEFYSMPVLKQIYIPPKIPCNTLGHLWSFSPTCSLQKPATKDHQGPTLPSLKLTAKAPENQWLVQMNFLLNLPISKGNVLVSGNVPVSVHQSTPGSKLCPIQRQLQLIYRFASFQPTSDGAKKKTAHDQLGSLK